VFRFLSVRPAALAAEDDRTVLHAGQEIGAGTASETLFQQIASAKAAGATPERLRAIVTDFKISPRYIGLLSEAPLPIPALLDSLRKASHVPLRDVNIPKVVKEQTGIALKDLVATEEYAGTYSRLVETIAADTLVPPAVGHRHDDVVTAVRALHLLERVANGLDISDTPETLSTFLSRLIVLLPKDVSIERAAPEPITLPRSTPEPDQDMLRDRLDLLVRSRRELITTAARRDAMVAETSGTQNGRSGEYPSGREPIVDLRALVEELKVEGTKRDARIRALAIERIRTLDAQATAELKLPTAEVMLKPEAIERLHPDTKTLLRELGLTLQRLNPLEALASIDEEMLHINSELRTNLETRTFVRFGSLMLDVNKLKSALGVEGAAGTLLPMPAGAFLHQCSFMAGIGDLLLVRQKLKAYELAEFAHVENALSGETREREHRRLNVREDITEIETEEEVEKERDLQSTERHELQTEAERTVKNEFNLEAGLKLSGSYGPSFSFSASLNTSFSTATEESQRKVMSYSREVTERSSERVRERVRELRRRRLLEEIEERNVHRIDNAKGNGHVRGIYRWLNKISDAQIYHYGQRMMFEFVVPEPAAFLLYALVDNPPADPEIVKPDPPSYGGSPLRPANLTLNNYNDYVAKYRVLSAPHPPSAFVVTSLFEKQDGNQENNFGRASKVTIPDGYEAFGAVVSSDYVFSQGKPASFRILVGDTGINRSAVWGTGFHYFPRKFRTEVTVSAQLMTARSFVLGVDVFCQLTTEGFRKWQHQIYDAIMQAYQQQLADYEDKLNAAAIEKGVQIFGRNPLENRRLERDELKKIIVMLLTQQNYLDFNGFMPTLEPILKLDQVCADGPYVRFFENAFEWQNVLYVFYPYFWGRHAKWISSLQLTDTDPDFAAFLKAGAARVQVPVRPGFERAITHFCQFGQIWEGNDPPLIDDDLYVPIIDEISTNLGKLDDGVPYPPDSEPWEVTVPTDLVVLQDLDEVSAIRDVMTGSDIDLE
jgi:hypothetical protein